MKTVKITLSGGFHNSNPVKVVIPADSFESLKDGYETIQGVLTDTQLRRMMKHFCGVPGCSCGGVRRACWEIAKAVK